MRDALEHEIDRWYRRMEQLLMGLQETDDDERILMALREMRKRVSALDALYEPPPPSPPPPTPSLSSDADHLVTAMKRSFRNRTFGSNY